MGVGDAAARVGDVTAGGPVGGPPARIIMVAQPGKDKATAKEVDSRGTTGGCEAEETADVAQQPAHPATAAEPPWCVPLASERPTAGRLAALGPLWLGAGGGQGLGRGAGCLVQQLAGHTSSCRGRRGRRRSTNESSLVRDYINIACIAVLLLGHLFARGKNCTERVGSSGNGRTALRLDEQLGR